MKTVSKKLLSLLLVAVLLVSAIPFQAFADPEEAPETPVTVAHDPQDPSHINNVWSYDASSHWKVCPKSDCELYNQPVGSKDPHSFSTESHACVTCGMACPHSTTKVVNEIKATCVKPGYSGDTVCAACETLISKGSETAATGTHTFNADHVCTVCGTKEAGKAGTITLDPNGGTVNGGTSYAVSVTEFAPIAYLPAAVKPGYTFAYWMTEAGVRVDQGSIWDGTTTKLIAKYVENTYPLTVRYVLNGNLATATTLFTKQVPAGTPLLDFLKTNVYADVKAALATKPGYSWQFNYFRDYSGLQELTDQSACMNQAQTVFVNFVTNSYKLYFNANGGTVSPAYKDVYFNAAVGTLPTPYLAGKVFQGWKDANGTIYTAGTVYQVAGDTSLTAVWQDEALVILYVYINGDFSAANRMIVMDGFVKGNNISRADVVAQVSKFYTPASGYLNIAGLFDEYTWSSYRVNTSKAGTENIEVGAVHPKKIYVMVTNARVGSTVVTGTTTTPTTGNMSSSVAGSTTGNTTGTTAGNTATNVPTGSYWVSTGNGTGYWVYPSNTPTSTIPTYVYTPTTNPKTGDTAMVEAAAAIMVLAAAALVTVMTMRKRKMF